MNDKKQVFVFGNQDLEFDSLPLRILPELKQRFLEIEFEIKDPNEELDLDDAYILDAIEDIAKTTLFSDLESFAPFRPRLTVHDFDLYTQLALLKKTSRLGSVKIIGIPPRLSESETINQVTDILNSILPSKNARRRTCRGHTLE